MALVKGLRVYAKTPNGFRRAGIAFGQDPVDLPLKSLTRQQIEALKAEPKLVVVETEVEVAAQG